MLPNYHPVPELNSLVLKSRLNPVHLLFAGGASDAVQLRQLLSQSVVMEKVDEPKQVV